MPTTNPEKFALVNGRVVLPDAIALGKAVVIEHAKIMGIADLVTLGSDMLQVDVGGRFIAPGLIDLHTHGALGHSFNEATASAFEAIVRANAQRGVTALLATMAAAPIADLARAFEFTRTWMRGSPPQDGAQILGAHLESPYIDPAQKGALDPASIRLPNDGSADALLEFRDVLKIFVLAPEQPGALDLVAKLVHAGIIPAAGHSSAKDDEVQAAMRLGLRHVTHIWSAMSMVVREGPWRKPGLLEAALTFDGLSVEMICDNRHLPQTLMHLAYKAVGADRLCVISDATSGAGLPEGARFGMGAMKYQVSDGVGMMFDRSAFAGSTTLVGQMIPNLINLVGVPVTEAIRMATLTPARVIRVADQKGSLAPGKDADIAIFDDDWSVWRVLIGGQFVEIGTQG